MLNWIRFAVIALLAAAASAQAQTALPPIASFFRQPVVSQPALSPSGRYLAVRVAGTDERMRLAVIDLESPQSKPVVVAAFRNANVAGHQWVNDQRLVFELHDTVEGFGPAIAEGLWGVDRDGNELRELIYSDREASNLGTNLKDRRLPPNWTLMHTLPDAGDEVIVLRRPWQDEPESLSVQLARLNTRSGAHRVLPGRLPTHVHHVDLDASGEPWSAQAVVAGRLRIFRRDAAGEWVIWQETASVGGSVTEPFWRGRDGRTLGTKYYQGFDALFELDPTSFEAAKQPVLTAPGYSFWGAPLVDQPTGQFLGVSMETDAPFQAWFDPRMKALAAEIDALLPGTVNLIGCLRCLDAKAVLVTGLSDRLPPRFFLYQTETKKVQMIAAAYSGFEAKQMGQRDVYRVPARDGLSLPVLVTQAAGGKPGARPTVLLVHGGPYVRGTHWAWEPMAQFLASRGYVVIEPEFRGSHGYGFAHFKAGWKQWGLGMQDDLADVMAWAIKQGWVDPQRVCIAGASYGGYAAMMGAVTQGDLFKCAINWVGVTDLGLMSSISWSDFSQEWKNYGMKQLVGDPVADAAQFAATSPLKRAGEIKMPLLLAYGGQDKRVPIKHGDDLRAALPRDLPVEWVSYPDEGHGWRLLRVNEDFWGRVERFLAKNIGDGKP